MMINMQTVAYLLAGTVVLLVSARAAGRYTTAT